MRTLPAPPHATTGDPEDIDTDADAGDHAADALRYLLIHLGVGPEFVIFDAATSAVLPGLHGGYGHRPPDYPTSPWWEQPAPADGEDQDDQQWWP